LSFSPYIDVDNSQRQAALLPRNLSVLETWGFGLTGHVGWIGTAPVIHAALGAKAIFVWLPGVIVAMMLNLQVQQLGKHWSNISGGTPNYAAQLLKAFPNLGRYVAIAYFFSWAAAPAIYAIILTELIRVNLAPLGIACPETILRIGFSAIAFIVAFSGSRALAILHLVFVVPAITFVITFCLQGLGWVALSHTEVVVTNNTLSFSEWAKWFFIATYSVYACETTSSFVADSQRPARTLQFLTVAAWLIPVVFLGGSWVLLALAPSSVSSDAFLSLVNASQHFWGSYASFVVTLLISFSCLLSCATAVANSPRILYQLALDKKLSPVFAVVSPQGVLEPALIFTFLVSCLCLVWGDVAQIVTVAGTAYLVSIMGLHLGLWLRRDAPEVRWGVWSLVFLLVETMVLVMGGLAWGWQNLLGGLAIPVVILVVDGAVRKISFAPFHPQWWLKRYQSIQSNFKDVVVDQVIILILLVCSATTIGWAIGGNLSRNLDRSHANLLVILLVTLSFIAIAIACWTTLPQIAAIEAARKQAKDLFSAALDTVPDTILVLKADGIIRQVNPPGAEIFDTNIQDLIGKPLHLFLPNLVGQPSQWANSSEQIIEVRQQTRILEVSISHPSPQRFPEYVAILRDITERKQAEISLRSSLATNRALLNALPDSIFRINAEGIVTSYIPKGDRLAVRNFLNKHISEILPANVIPEAMQCLQQALFSQELQIFEYQMSVEQDLHDYEVRLVVSGENEVLAIVRDITERKQAEADMQVTLAKEKELSQLKSRFVTMTSHEFRTPLTTILSSAELIEKYGFKWTEEKKGQHLSRIQSSVKHMTQLLNDVLLIGQAEVGKIDFNPHAIDLIQFCQDVVEEVQISTPTHKIAWNNESSCLNACIDEKLLRQILSNLLTNAIKYSPQGGVVHFELICTPQTAIFRIQDSGIGIPISEQINLFDSFYRASNVGTISGTGLGLAIVKKSVDLHGGEIAVESEVGVGTTFTVTLPLN
jgi:PAS domain S-box-containing protein